MGTIAVCAVGPILHLTLVRSVSCGGTLSAGELAAATLRAVTKTLAFEATSWVGNIGSHIQLQVSCFEMFRQGTGAKRNNYVFCWDFLLITPNFDSLYLCHLLVLPALEELTFSQVKQVLIRYNASGSVE